MSTIFGPSVSYGSDKGDINPCMLSNYVASGEQTGNISMVGTNILEPLLAMQVPATYTYTLDGSGKTITLSSYYQTPGDPTSSTLLSITTYGFSSGNIPLYQRPSGRIMDGLYIAIDPYTDDVDDVSHWIFLSHYSTAGSNPGYYFEVSPSTMVDVFRGSQNTNDDDILKSDGGMGLLDTKSDVIPFPALPIYNFLDTNMISVYDVSTSELQSFKNYLWSGNFLTDITKIQNDPMEAVIGLNLMPVIPTTSAANIKIGDVDTGISSKQVTQQYYYIDFGKITINENIGTFYDWSPFTRAEIYMPFIGCRSLDVNEIMGSQLWLQYMVDVVSGNFTAMILIERLNKKNVNEQLKGILYHWNGYMASPCAISAKDYTELYKAAIGAISSTVTGAVGGAVMGGPAGAAVGAASGIMKGAGSMMTTPIPIQHTGNVAANNGMMSIQSAYVILSRPTVVAPSSIRSDMGFNSKVTATIGSLSGWAKMEEIHVAIQGATEEECKEIETLLKNGIHI